MTTLRPLGPSVTFTALLRISTPRRMRSRASVEKRTSLAAIVFKLQRRSREVKRKRGSSGDDAEDVAFLHDEEVFAVDLDFRARPFSEQNIVADLDVQRNQLAAFVTGTGADCNDFAFLGFFLGAVGNDDAALGLLFAFEAPI